METETQASMRYRVNVSTSVKGVKTWDCTVEGTKTIDGMGWSKEEVLAESDALVAALDARYPAPAEGGKS